MEITQLIDILTKQKLTLDLDANGNVTREGLMVTRVQNGYLVHNLNKEFQPRSLKKEQIEALVKQFPALQPILSRNADTLRRVQYLEERYNSLPKAKFFSLDPQRPMPPRGSSSVNETTKLPRFYGNIDNSDPENPVVSIFGSELGIKSQSKTRRPDEAMFSFEISKEHAAELESATTIDELKDVLKKVTARNARLIYYDDNAIITGERAEDHALKTLDTLEVWAKHVLETFEIKIRGELFLHSLEDLVLQPGVLVDSSGAKPARMKVDFRQPGEAVMTTHSSILITVEEAAGQVKVTRVPGKDIERISETLTKTDVKALEARVNKVVAAIEAALVKIK